LLDLFEELRQTLPPIWLGSRTDELTGHAICWGTIQNRRSRREVPEECFVRSGNRVLIIRDKFLPWWISTLSEARRPPVLQPRPRHRTDGRCTPVRDRLFDVSLSPLAVSPDPDPGASAAEPDAAAADYYRERNREIRRVLQAHFGKQNVKVTAGWEQGRVTARIDSDLNIGELIDIVRKLLSDAGIAVRMAGGPINADADLRDTAPGSYLWVHSRFENETPTHRGSGRLGR
jgi:hypothetical protein